MTKLFVGYETSLPGYTAPPTVGQPVEIPMFHMLVTGQTQRSGKTTVVKTLARQAVKYGYKVLVFDSVPGYTPIIIKDSNGVDILPIEDLYEQSAGAVCGNGPHKTGPPMELVKTLHSPIQTLSVGRQGKHEASWSGSITTIIRHPYKGNLIRLNTTSGLVDVSPNHSVIKTYTGNGKEQVVDARTISVSDTLSFLPVHDVATRKSGDFIGTEELAWLYGLFVAEGWLHTYPVKRKGKEWIAYSVVISNSDPEILGKATRIMEIFFHRKVTLSKHHGANTIQVSSKYLYEHFKKLCYTLNGKHAEGKRVPRTILNAPASIKKAFLDGYILGDGHVGEYGVSFTTNSQCLAMGIIWLHETVAHSSWSTHIRDDKPQAIFVNFNKGTRNSIKPGKVKKIKEFEYDGYLYDLCVPFDNSFCAGVGPIRVHNTKQNYADYENFGTEIPVCLRETTDSLTILGLLESIMGRKLTMQYATLSRVSENANSFKEVLKNAEVLEEKARAGFVQDAARVLIDLMKRLIEQTEGRQTTAKLELTSSINRISINKFTLEGQQMIIKTAFEDALNHTKLIIILDEASKFLPQRYRSACQRAINHYVTQGAISEDYLWLATQFLATTSKDQMKAADVKLLGRQSHTTECAHTIDLIPKIGLHKLTSDSVMQLKLGHFIVVADNWVKTVYTCPENADPLECREVAIGRRQPDDIHYRFPGLLTGDDLKKLSKNVPSELYELPKIEPLFETPPPPPAPAPKPKIEKQPKKRSPNIPPVPSVTEQALSLEQIHTKISVVPVVKQLTASTDNSRGQILMLAKDGFFSSWHPLREVTNELEQKHWTAPTDEVKKALYALVEDKILAAKKVKREYVYSLCPYMEFLE